MEQPALIIDPLYKLRLVKWRLMSDQVPVRYLTESPDIDIIREINPSSVIIQYGFFEAMDNLFQEIRNEFPHLPVLTIIKNGSDSLIKHVFSKGAKAVVSFPLDLPQISGFCLKQLEGEKQQKVQKTKEIGKFAQFDIARSEKLIMAGQLAAEAVHEIRNPLTSVRGFIQLLKKELSGTPKEAYIDIIINEIDRANNIVTEFLSLAKPTIAKRSSCSLSVLFEEIRVLMESEAYLKNVEIEEYFDNIPMVELDKEQIKQVIMNIMQNAFDAMAEGGSLKIIVKPEELKKVIEIQFVDNGCGMSDETLEKLFEPFYTTKELGTGLGLSVSQEIVKQHGGQLEVSSQLNKGTIVTLKLPY